MSVLVDTCVWSIALRRRRSGDARTASRLESLIEENRACLIGPIRQEILSGYSDPAKFAQLRDRLDPFPDLPIAASDYIAAAGFSNDCRRKGIQGSHTDFLICAVAIRYGIPVFTVDRDFERYARVIPLNLLPDPRRD